MFCCGDTYDVGVCALEWNCFRSLITSFDGIVEQQSSVFT